MLSGTNPETAIVRVRKFIEATEKLSGVTDLLAIAPNPSVVPGLNGIAPLFRSDVAALLERLSTTQPEGPRDGALHGAQVIELPTIQLPTADDSTDSSD